MNQKTARQSEENKKMWGSGSDTSSLPRISGEVELKEAMYNCGTETNNIRHLLNELKGLYEQRLRCLELDSTSTREELLQVSMPPFRCYS